MAQIHTTGKDDSEKNDETGKNSGSFNRRLSTARDEGGEKLAKLGDMMQEGIDGASNWASKASSKVSDKIDEAGSYFKDHSLKEMGKDAVKLIKSNPIPSLLCGVAIGITVDRLLFRGHKAQYTTDT